MKPTDSGRQDAVSVRRSVWMLGALSGGYFVCLLLPSWLSPHYGFYSDELYYLACADRLAFGYVDHPPLFVFALRGTRELLGDSLVALRTLPAAAGALTIFLTGWMARRLGGGLYAQALAGLGMMMGQSLVLFGFFSVNCLGILWWTVACACFLELAQSRNARWWIPLGLTLGLAFLTKHTIAVLMVGLAAGTLISPLRHDLRTRWPWLGALAFALVAAPNVYWQMDNDWVSLDFYRKHASDNLPLSPLDVVVQQIVAQNPATLPVWVAGVILMLRTANLRPLGWAFLSVFGLAVISGQAVPYRIAGVYPMAYAAGAVLLAGRRRRDAGPLRRLWNTWTLPACMLLVGALAASLTMPILPPDVLKGHPLNEDDGWRRKVGEKRLPYHLGNRTHWQALVDDVRRVANGLEPAERRDAIVLADYFGHAGAVEYYGRDLPPVYSQHTGYFLWGPPPATTRTVISIGIDEAFLRANFESVITPAVFRCTWCPPWQDELPIRVARGPTRPFAELWPELGAMGGMSRYRRLLRDADQ